MARHEISFDSEGLLHFAAIASGSLVTHSLQRSLCANPAPKNVKPQIGEVRELQQLYIHWDLGLTLEFLFFRI